MAKPKKPAVVEKMTVKQFQTWIKGLCAFQDDSWLPNKNQWEHIRQLIDNLDETTVQNVTVVQQPNQVQLPTQPNGGASTQRMEGVPQQPMNVSQALSTDVAPTPQRNFPLLNSGISQNSRPIERDESGHPIRQPIKPGESDFA